MLEDAIEQRVRDIALVEEQVGNAVAWGRRLPGLPSISLQIISDPRPQHFKGFQSARPTLAQVDVVAKTPEQARALREALIVALVAPASIGTVRFQRAEVTNVRAGAAEQQGGDMRLRPEIFRESIDIRFWHNG